MERRDFLKMSAGSLLGAAALTHFGCSAAPEPRKLPHIGLQLYTVRSLMNEDFEGTIERVAALGFSQLEFAGYYGRTPQEVKALLDRLGVASPANHTGYDALKNNLADSIETAQIMGQKFLILPMLPIDWSKLQPAEGEDILQKQLFTKDEVMSYAEFMNAVGAECQKSGLRFAYHNHHFEFTPTEDGTLMYDMLLQNTNPELVDMELDLYWAMKGKHAPLDLFEKYPGRFKLCHVKGMTNDEKEDMMPVGEGKIDFAAVFAQSEKAGLQYYIVEHDNPQDALASITESVGYLQNLTF